MRLFIAIPLASEAVGALERLAHTLRSASDSLRWTSPATKTTQPALKGLAQF